MWWVRWILVALTVFPLACPVLASFSTSFSTYAFPFQILCLNGTRFLPNWHKFLWLIAATCMSWSFGGTKKLRKIFKPCGLTGVFVEALHCSAPAQINIPRDFWTQAMATKKHPAMIFYSKQQRTGTEERTTVDGQNPAPPRVMIIPSLNRVLTIPGGCLGFCPSTVPLKVPCFFSLYKPKTHVWIKRIFGCSKNISERWWTSHCPRV